MVKRGCREGEPVGRTGSRPWTESGRAKLRVIRWLKVILMPLLILM